MSTSPRRSQTLARLGLGGLMVYAGVSHLSFKRQEFQAQVPEPSTWAAIAAGAGLLGFVTLRQRRRLVRLA